MSKSKPSLNELRDQLIHTEEQIEMYADVESEEDHAMVEHYVDEQIRLTAIIKDKEYWLNKALEKGRAQGYNC